MQNNLSKFSYLVKKNFKEITNIFLQNHENKNIHTDITQFYLMAILKTLGFSIVGVRFPYIGKTTKQKENLFDFGLEPWIDFTTKEKPEEKYEHEYIVVKSELEKMKYSDFHPYLNWTDNQGEEIRKTVYQKLQEENITHEYKKWLKSHEDNIQEFSSLIEAFENENKSKLHFYLDEEKGTLSITSQKRYKTKKRYTLTKEEKVKIAKQYEKDLQLFIDYINKQYKKITRNL